MAFLLSPEGDAYLLTSLPEEQELVQGSIERIDFVNHTVHLGQAQGSPTGQNRPRTVYAQENSPENQGP